MSVQTIHRAIDDYEKRGKIKKGEFYVRTKGKGSLSKRRTFIVHRGKKT